MNLNQFEFYDKIKSSLYTLEFDQILSKIKETLYNFKLKLETGKK